MKSLLDKLLNYMNDFRSICINLKTLAQLKVAAKRRILLPKWRYQIVLRSVKNSSGIEQNEGSFLVRTLKQRAINVLDHVS